ncbi:MAG TPA: carboxypeptidase regulatory-like domain-containing protein [Thermoanaerobaculia bacterium]|nr:carboxypeptidase regulatory-like domain-containing protein [Thermoanaerobaculia bacterium]
MRRPSFARRWAAIAATLLVALTAVSAYAQFQTGGIFGRTVAKDGSVLPGVTVTLSGVGAPRTTVSDAQGNFRFINLDPGQYTVKAELAGFGSATRSGVNVSVGQNADVSLTLNPAVTEAITVTADAPLLDVRKTGTGATVSKVELEKVPTARDPWMVLQSTPGVLVDRINVGGTQSGQQSIYISKGAPRQDGTWNIDGVNITDMGATGSSPTYYDFDMFEEMQITTGGSDPRIQTGGVQMNMVTKRGTNDYKGSGRYLYVPGSTSDEATVPAEAKGYLSLTNRVNYVRDYGAELGGPIWRDRLWLWIARGDQKISTWQSLSFPAPRFFIPDDTILRNKNAKLNAQPFANNSFVGSYTFGDKFRNARDLSPTRPFEASWKQTGPTKVYKLEDTHIFGSSFYLTGMWSKVDGGFGLFANGGEGSSAPSAWRNKDGVWNNSYLTYQTERPQKQYRADGSTFLSFGNMNHELKFGYGYRHTPVHSTSTWPGPAFGYWDYATTGNSTTICPNQSLPSNCAIATLIRPPVASYDEKYNELYVGDTILLGNLTIQAGLRWDSQKSKIQPIDVGPNPVLATPLDLPCISTLSCAGGRLAAQLPGLAYPGQNRYVEWKNISPRIGVTYAMGADRKTLLRAGYNRYVTQMGSAISSSSPLSYSFMTFYGVDSNGDNTIQRSELARVRSWGGFNPLSPTSIAGSRRVDYDMNAPTTDELMFGFERELFSDFSVGMNFTYREVKDLLTIRWEKTQGAGDYYSRSDYELTNRTAGGTFTLRDPITGATITTFTTSTVPVWQLKAGVPTPNFSVITNRPDYKQKYKGVELTATKRMSHRWMMRFNASFNDYTDDCGENSFANPTPSLNSTGSVNGQAASGGAPACPGGQIAPQSAGSGAFGNVFINSRWNFNLNGIYVFPWDITLGANLFARQGYPAVLRDTITGLRGGTIGVVLDPIGEIRFPNVYQLDLRLAKDFRIMNRISITPSIDVFNVTNERTVLQRNTAILQNGASVSSGWRITELQAPRVYRFGGKITF